jgi:hypothetical protein
MRKKCHFSVGVLDREIEREREREREPVCNFVGLFGSCSNDYGLEKNFGVAT